MFGVFLGGWAYARSAPSLVLRFDDNKSVSQWREVAGIFEAVGSRCSFAVNSATLSIDLEQCRALARKLKENGVPMTTYAHIAEASARSCQNR